MSKINITVDVTEHHINNAERHNPGQCVLAEAIRTRLNKYTEVYPASRKICIEKVASNKRYWIHCLLPSEAAKIGRDFDNGIRPAPFSFLIEVDKDELL